MLKTLSKTVTFMTFMYRYILFCTKFFMKASQERIYVLLNLNGDLYGYIIMKT